MAQLDHRLAMAVPNVLAQQAQVTQNNALNAQALGQGFDAVYRGMEAPLRRNVLQAQAGSMNLEQTRAEQQMLGGVLDNLAQSQNPAQDWLTAREFLISKGVFEPGELPENLTPETYQSLSTIALTPAEELTDMQRYGGWLNSENPEQQKAARVFFGLDPKASSGNGFTFSTTPDGGFTFSQGDGGTVPPNPDKRSAAFGTELGKQDAAKVEERRKFQNNIGALERRDTILLNTIDDAIAQAEGSSWNTGFIGQQSAEIGGTPAFKLNQTLKTIQANLGFNELNQMRANSPTGGALGQVTERELAFLQAVQGSLDIGQGDKQLIANLRQIRKGIEANAQERQMAFERDFGAQTPEKPAFDLSTVSDEELMRALGAAQ